MTGVLVLWLAMPASAQVSPSANEKISLTGAPPPAAADPAPATPPPATVDPAPETPPSAPQETRTLGEPNGALAARPAAEAAETDEVAASAAWWHAIDPRRNEIARVVAALAVVIGLMLLLRSFAMRSQALAGGGRPSGVVEILARYPVSRGQRLMLIKLARRVVLVHQTGAAMTTLAEVSDPDEVASLLARIEAGSRGREATRFKSLLRRHESEYGRPERAEAPSFRGVKKGTVADVVDLTRVRRRPLLGPQGKLA